MKSWLLFGLGIVAFLVSAKAHGGQLRVERELAGYLQVTFGGENPPWVEALWWRERLYFFGATLVFTFCSLAARKLLPISKLKYSRWEPPLVVATLLHLLLPLIGAFIATGLFSAIRTATLVGAGWWLLSLGLSVSLCGFVRSSARAWFPPR